MYNNKYNIPNVIKTYLKGIGFNNFISFLFLKMHKLNMNIILSFLKLNKI